MNDHFHAQLADFESHRSPAAGLPACAYRDGEFWQAECRTVLADNWIFVGFAHELAKPGDVVPTFVGDQPILLVRTGAGDIRAFHNVCRHRCLKLVEEAGNVGKLIRCPYHAWAYDLTGELRASPHFGGVDMQEPEGFRKKDNGLVPLRCHVWHDWVFVNPSGRAPGFEDYAATLIKRFEGIDLANLKLIGMLDFGVIEANWKFIMENFIEPYHVQFVHAKTTSQPIGDHYTIIDDNCIGSAVDLPSEEVGADSLAVSSRYLTLFPNFIIARYFPDQLGVYHNLPRGPRATHQRRAIYLTGGKTLPADAIEAVKRLWWDVHREDHAMCERLQLGRASPVSDRGGVLSPIWEDSVRAFQDKVARAVAPPHAN